jgi:Tol biopolymer transport system component
MSKTRWGALLAMLLLACVLPAVAQAEQCPNEQLRREDNSMQLPECRAYELVSPPLKKGAAIYGVEPVLTAPSGESAFYGSTGAFAGAPAAPVINNYVATRGPSGWSTRPVEAPQANEGLTLGVPTQGVSEDLTSVLQSSALVLAPGAVQGQGNVYVSNTATGTRTLVGTSGGRYAFREFGSDIYSTYVGGSSDFSHVVFSYPYALMPGSVEGTANLYDWTDGALHLVNYLPDGTLGTGVGTFGRLSEDHSVSSDGSKIFFDAEGALYVREDDARTIPISVSQRAGASSTPQEGTFVGASADGSKVYFTSFANLVEGPETGTPKLYRYDLDTGQLTAPVPTSAEVEGVLRVSEDGSYVYFTALAALTPGATQQQFGSPNTYVWHEGQGVKLIAHGVGGGEVSPNGLHFAFVSTQHLTSFPCSGCSLLYDYDYATGSIRCVSCNPTGAPPSAPVDFAPDRVVTALDAYPSRSVLDDGRIFFDTRDSLLPQDTNGQYDVYEWQDGQLTLLSSGTASEESIFSDASPDGTNVFFKTGQALVGQDIDAADDLYDARVDGGFPAPAVTPPCSGTGCQGTPPAPPIFATPPSETFAGVGNFEPGPKSRSKPKPAATKAQKLTAALKLCRRHKHMQQRAACERQARNAYGKAAGKHAKTSSTKSDRRGK